MAFENLTLFEISLDGAQFGPRSLGRRSGEADDVGPATRSGRGRLASLLVVALVVGTALFRSRGRRADAEPEDAGAELAASR